MSRQSIIFDNKEFVFGHDHATGWFYQLYVDDKLKINLSELFDNISVGDVIYVAKKYNIIISEEMIESHLNETPRTRYETYQNPWFDHLK